MNSPVNHIRSIQSCKIKVSINVDNALKRKVLRFKVEAKAQKCYNGEKEHEVSS